MDRITYLNNFQETYFFYCLFLNSICTVRKMYTSSVCPSFYLWISDFLFMLPRFYWPWNVMVRDNSIFSTYFKAIKEPYISLHLFQCILNVNGTYNQNFICRKFVAKGNNSFTQISGWKFQKLLKVKNLEVWSSQF